MKKTLFIIAIIFSFNCQAQKNIEVQNESYIKDEMFTPSSCISVHWNKKSMKFAYFDENNQKYISKFVFDGAINFRNGLGRVCINRKFGAVDINGKIVVPIKYDIVSYKKIIEEKFCR